MAGRPRVVLLHSGMCTPVEWRRTIALLPELEVLTPTLPGSAGGPSLDVRSPILRQQADHVERVLDEAGWTEPVLVVGSSFGGVAALELLGRGRATAAMALAPPWTGSPAGLAFYAALFTPALTAVRATRPLWPRTTRIDLVNSLFFHSSRQPLQLDHADAEELLRSIAAFPFFGVGTHGRGPGVLDLSSVDGRAATLVFGDRDLLVPRWMRTRWQRALPDARVVDLPGFPHQPHLRDPARVAGLVRELVQ